LFTNFAQGMIKEFRVEYLAKLALPEAGRKCGLDM
jgi:hypothetical protein